VHRHGLLVVGDLEAPVERARDLLDRPLHDVAVHLQALALPGRLVRDHLVDVLVVLHGRRRARDEQIAEATDDDRQGRNDLEHPRRLLTHLGLLFPPVRRQG
jgi:hypothetical protein